MCGMLLPHKAPMIFRWLAGELAPGGFRLFGITLRVWVNYSV